MKVVESCREPCELGLTVGADRIEPRERARELTPADDRYEEWLTPGRLARPRHMVVRESPLVVIASVDLLRSRYGAV